MELHPSLAPVAFLLGTFEGTGSGWYPTVADFTYRERATWSHGGKPVLVYASQTWATDDGRPLHGERGFLRVVGEVTEFVVAHSNGFVEMATGPVGEPLELVSVAVVGTPSAKEVSALDRRFWSDGSGLQYTLGMTAVGQPRSPHLEAALIRVADTGGP